MALKMLLYGQVPLGTIQLVWERGAKRRVWLENRRIRKPEGGTDKETGGRSM